MNTFASELKNLLNKTDIKNSSVADAVKYDSSYISKWLSGKAIPPERNIERIAMQIAACVVKEGSEADLLILCDKYGVDISVLEKTISDRLILAYESETANNNEIGYETFSLLLPMMKNISWQGESVVAADIFSMEHESRLFLAGIKDGEFIGDGLASGDREGSIRILVNVSAIKDKIYDPIFLVHMMTSFSNTNLELYNSSFATGKFIYADEKNLISAHLLDGGHVLSVVKQENAEVADDIRMRIGSLCTQENALTHKMDSLLDGYVYMQSLLSSRHDWLTGHFTEQMIPEKLFKELCESNQLHPEDEKIQRIGTLLKTAMPNARLLIYRTAFDKLTVSGELDFFNSKVVLTNTQQKECIKYIRSYAEEGNVRIINGPYRHTMILKKSRQRRNLL